MAQIKSEWEQVREAEEIVNKLCTLYPERFGHVTPESIGCVAITNKEQSGAVDSKIRGVRMPEALFCTKTYVIQFCYSTWENYTPAQRSVMIMKHLLRIPDTEDGPDGSLLTETLKDNRCLVKAFGVDYMKNDVLPDMAEAKIPLPDDVLAE